jgi:hypothetical protein
MQTIPILLLLDMELDQRVVTPSSFVPSFSILETKSFRLKKQCAASRCKGVDGKTQKGITQKVLFGLTKSLKKERLKGRRTLAERNLVESHF